MLEKVFQEAFESMEKWIARDSIRRNGFATYNELNVISTNSLQEFITEIEQFLQQFAFLTAIYLSSLVAFVIFPCAIAPMLQANNSVIEIESKIPIFVNSTMILLEQNSYHLILPKVFKKLNSQEWNFPAILYKNFGRNWENEINFNQMFGQSIC